MYVAKSKIYTLEVELEYVPDPALIANLIFVISASRLEDLEQQVEQLLTGSSSTTSHQQTPNTVIGLGNTSFYSSVADPDPVFEKNFAEPKFFTLTKPEPTWKIWVILNRSWRRFFVWKFLVEP